MKLPALNDRLLWMAGLSRLKLSAAEITIAKLLDMAGQPPEVIADEVKRHVRTTRNEMDYRGLFAAPRIRRRHITEGK